MRAIIVRPAVMRAVVMRMAVTRTVTVKPPTGGCEAAHTQPLFIKHIVLVINIGYYSRREKDFNGE